MKATKDPNSDYFDVDLHQRIFKEKTGKEFSDFYQKFNDKLNFFNYKLTMDKQLAEDFSSEAFMTALRKINTYESEISEPSTWLFTISRNLIFQEKKKNKYMVISMDNKIDDEGTTIKDFIADTSEKAYENKRIYEAKMEAITKYIPMLKEPYRTVIEMREIQKMTYDDIAKKLQLNESTCKSQIRNGRIYLKKMMKRDIDIINRM